MLDSKSLRAHIVKGASGSLALQLGFAGLAFLNAVILARLLGSVGYGAFANAMAWINIFVVFATFGFGTLLVRDIAVFSSNSKWADLKGLIKFSNNFVLAFSLALSFIFIAITSALFSMPEQNLMRMSLWMAAPLIPIFALLSLRESIIRGFEFVFFAKLASMIFRPSILLIGIILINLFYPNVLSASVAIIINVGAGIMALVVCVLIFKKILPIEVQRAQSTNDARTTLKTAFPMLIFGCTQVILGQTDIVMLGLMRSDEDVGLYASANRLAFLLGYVMMAAEMIMAPIIARLYADGEREQLQKIITSAVRISFVSILPFGLFLIFYGENILVVFGDDFIFAKSALIILVIGRLMHVVFGPGALLLSMTGHEKTVASILASTAILNMSINAILIPKYGIEGAAIASAICLVFMRSIFSFFSVLKIGQHATIFGVVNFFSFKEKI